MTFTHKIKKLIAEKVIEDYPRDAHPSLTYSAEFKLSELREPGKKYIITVQEIHPLLKKTMNNLMKMTQSAYIEQVTFKPLFGIDDEWGGYYTIDYKLEVQIKGKKIFEYLEQHT